MAEKVNHKPQQEAQEANDSFAPDARLVQALRHIATAKALITEYHEQHPDNDELTESMKDAKGFCDDAGHYICEILNYEVLNLYYKPIYTPTL